jgi:phosphonate transport system substrate-binding protein
MVALSLLVVGCGRKRPQRIDLSKRSDLPAAVAPGNGSATLKIAVSAMVSPAATIDSYEALVRLMGERLDEDVELVQRRTYAEVNSLLREGRVQVAFVCTGAFIAGEEEFGLEAVASPVVHGKSHYQSFIIARAGDEAWDFSDLGGRSFAFTDPLSNTGRLHPLLLLQQAGTTPGEFFSRTLFTGSHDRSIEAVRQGLVDAAAVDNLIFEDVTARPEIRREFKVLGKSPEFGMPPVVVSPRLEKTTRDRVAACLLSLGHDEESKRALAGAGIDEFVRPKSSWYDSVRQMRRTLAQAGMLKR